MTFIIIIYFSLFFSFMMGLIVLAVNYKEEHKKELKVFPQVSILICARNEENNIIDCLSAIEKNNYPKENYEVLIGNDRSEDNTEKVVNNFIKGKANYKLIDIDSDMGLARGKANVLAHLTKHASGEYFFITDADIEIPKNWISGLLKYCNDETGIVSGATMVKGKSIFAKLQALEWIYAFGMVRTVSDLNIPVTAVGNNMVISRKAYESTGGYENIPFSLTEDFQLFRETLKRGWTYKNLLNTEALAYSKPAESFQKLLMQRKRWMTGAFQLPFILVLFLSVQAFFLPLIIVTLFLFPAWGGLLWMCKILLQQVFIALTLRRIRNGSSLLKYFLLFEIYSGFLSFFLMIFYILPVKVEWKGRKF
jgi:cellulose synthase/poly-beta-1,6-N-acetylglucosamine synthase-like glycosyltransferase